MIRTGHITTFLMVVLAAACSDEGGWIADSGTDGPVVNPLADIDRSTINPPEGSIVGPYDSPLEVGVETPGANPDYSGTLPATVDVLVVATGDGATSDAGDDWTVEVIHRTAVSLERYTSAELDLLAVDGGAGARDGEQIRFEFTVSSLRAGETFTRSASVIATYDAPESNPVVVTGCDVTGASIGLSLAIDCDAETPGTSLAWSVEGGPTGTAIDTAGHIGMTRLLESTDIGVASITVTADDGVFTSAPFTFSASVDEHASTVTLVCSDATSHELMLPESSVDGVATGCGTGFDAGLKPGSSMGAVYTLDVDAGCVTATIDGLDAAELAMHPYYNGGTLVADVYSACTVDSASVSYRSNL